MIKCAPCDSSHGNGSIVPAVTKTYVEGQLVATFGAIFLCPLDPPNPIVFTNTNKTYAEDLLIAVDGATCACGAVLSANCTKTSAE